MYIAIDTATDDAGLALFEDGRIVDEISWHSNRNHSSELLPQLDKLLRKNGLKPADISGVIAAKGPGSFNGLRVGLSTAKGLAFSLGMPLAGMSSLAAEACRYTETGLPVAAVFEAGRGELAIAIYKIESGKRLQLEAEHIATAAALAAGTREKTVFCGEMAAETISAIREALKDMAIFPPPAKISRVACLAILGAERLNAGDTDDVAALSALYLRRPPITEAKIINRPILKIGMESN